MNTEPDAKVLLEMCEKLLSNPNGYNESSLTIAAWAKSRLVAELRVPDTWRKALLAPTPGMIDAGGRNIAFKTQHFGGALTLDRYSSLEIEQANRERAEAAWEAMAPIVLRIYGDAVRNAQK